MCGFFFLHSWSEEEKTLKLSASRKKHIKESLIERGQELYSEKEYKSEKNYTYQSHSLLPIYGDKETSYPIINNDSSLLFNGQIYSIKDKVIKHMNYKSDGLALKEYLDKVNIKSFTNIFDI